MSIEALKSALPDYAKDLKLNLSNVLTTPGMTASQIWGTALA
ncbi:MAG: alkyl hydroperoxide reductase, partial [Alphaproteobacteria bacterium]|nr:alkyl hydroperoxide reductase [Alphaproteobacteria bacterium]